MTSFKEKNIKYAPIRLSKVESITSTLDMQHRKKLEDIDVKEDTIVRLQSKRDRVAGDIDRIEGKVQTNTTERRLLNLRKDLEDIDAEVQALQRECDRLEYYDKSFEILMNYYNDGGRDPPPSVLGAALQDKKSTKRHLYEKYMRVVNNQSGRKKQVPMVICRKCAVEKVLHMTDGLYICVQCGETDPILLDSEKPNHKEPGYDNKASAYKRINHLSELLNQFQAKESTDISESVYSQIKDELKKQRVVDFKSLTYKHMRLILKKLKLNKYYEHIHHIINKLNGVPPPCMTRETEEQLKHMFKDIQKPFMMFRPKHRKNFLSYNYIIHKLCQLLELDEFLPFFQLLKSRDKLEEQDAIWEKICRYRNYQFIPSL